MKLEPLEPRRDLGQLLFAVLVEEKPRIGQPGADHPLVALTDQTLGVVLAIGYGDEAGLESTSSAFSSTRHFWW